MREECHSKFGDPVPEEKKNICDYEDVSCLFAWWDIDDNQSWERKEMKEERARASACEGKQNKKLGTYKY